MASSVHPAPSSMKPTTQSCHNGPARDLWSVGLAVFRRVERKHYEPERTRFHFAIRRSIEHGGTRTLGILHSCEDLVRSRSGDTIGREDWLDAIEQVLGPNQPHNHDWRAVTIVASSRLGHRLTVATSKASGAHHNSFGSPIKPQVTPDFARSKQNSVVRDSSKIDSSPR